MSILIRNVLLNNATTDVLIEGNEFTGISPGINAQADTVIDGTNKAIMPPFSNAHTHAAMTLMRGFADDMLLEPWLKEKIWPTENNLTADACYWGTRLACLEMIRSGTTFLNDMYWFCEETARAVQDSGIRAAIATPFIDLGIREKAEEMKRETKKHLERINHDRITKVLGPHAIYTVSEENLRFIADLAEQEGLHIHIHLSETEHEVEECLKKTGKRPVHYLDACGLLGPRTIAAHAVWLDDEEIALLKERDVGIAACPVSNMKLSVKGMFPYQKCKDLRIGIGTDGAASNNSLSMFDEVKTLALAQKMYNGPDVLPAHTAYKLATSGGASLFGIESGIEEGKPADCILIDLNMPQMTPCHDITSHMVYAADPSCVDTTICDGRILMRDRIIEDEERILEKAGEQARNILGGA